MPRISVVDLDHLGAERLAAGEGEQLAGQRRRPRRRLDDRVGEAEALVLGQRRAAEHVGRALDDGQQIVEIVGDAAGQLAQAPASCAPGAADPRPWCAR